MKELTLEELYDLEAKYPPLVGCRTQVFLEPHERAAASIKAKSMSDEELAHVLKNLLTPVQTFLQLCGETRLNQEAIDELRPTCLRNLETIRSYVCEIRGHQPATR